MTPPTTPDLSVLEARLAQAYPAVWRLALAVTGSPSDADDVVQQASLRVLEAARRQGPPRELLPYLRRAVVNTARNTARDEGRRRWRESQRASSPHDDPSRPGELRAWVHAQLATLSPECRAALALHYLEGLSLREVADVLDCPPGTAASRVRRGLEVLRRREDPRHTQAGPLLALALGGARTSWPSKHALITRGLAAASFMVLTLGAIHMVADAPSSSVAALGRSPGAPRPALGRVTSRADGVAPPPAGTRARGAPVAAADLVTPLEPLEPLSPGGCRVRGRVLDVDGRGLPGAQLRLGVEDLAVSGADGRFSIVSRQAQLELLTPTEPGTDAQIVGPPEGASGRPERYGLWVHAAGHAPQLLSLDPGDHALDVALEPGGVTLSLRRVEPAPGGLRPQAAAALGGAVLAVSQHGRRLEVVTDAAGLARVDGLAPGWVEVRGPTEAWRLVVSAAPLQCRTLVGTSPVAPDPVEPSSTEARTPPSEAPPVQRRLIRLRVSDEAGRPLPGAFAWGDTSDAWVFGRTDVWGEVSLPTPAGATHLGVEGPQSSHHSWFPTRISLPSGEGACALEVTLRAPRYVQVQLDLPGRADGQGLEVEVLDARGDPLAYPIQPRRSWVWDGRAAVGVVAPSGEPGLSLRVRVSGEPDQVRPLGRVDVHGERRELLLPR